MASSPEVGAGCGQAARPDLWRGLWVNHDSYSDFGHRPETTGILIRQIAPGAPWHSQVRHVGCGEMHSLSAPRRRGWQVATAVLGVTYVGVWLANGASEAMRWATLAATAVLGVTYLGISLANGASEAMRWATLAATFRTKDRSVRAGSRGRTARRRGRARRRRGRHGL